MRHNILSTASTPYKIAPSKTSNIQINRQILKKTIKHHPRSEALSKAANPDPAGDK